NERVKGRAGGAKGCNSRPILCWSPSAALGTIQTRRKESHEVSAERRDRKKPLMAERTKRSATPKMGAQGIQFQTGRSIIACVGLPGSYKTITGTFLLPAILLPSQS